MPIFEYQCIDCLTTFERLILRTENATAPVCPQCSGDNTAKQFSTFSTQSGSTQSGSTQSGSTQSGSTQSGSTQSGSTQSGSTQSGGLASTGASAPPAFT
ncbi:hypothetical protein C2W62_05735 [Candidatus Entotheonella serta]|nr:hypothetical protein C2W62_05735 [Candidatus Entotheonella serta]